MKLRVTILALLALVLSVLTTACGSQPEEQQAPYFQLENGRHYALTIDGDKVPAPGAVALKSRLWENPKGQPYNSYAMTVNVPTVDNMDGRGLGVLSIDLLAGNIRQVIVTDRPATIQFWMEDDWTTTIDKIQPQLAHAEVVLYVSAEQKKAMGL